MMPASLDMLPLRRCAKTVHMARISLALLVCLAIASLAGCGKGGNETEASQDMQGEQPAQSEQPAQQEEQEAAPEEPAYAIEVAGCHLKPEKIAQFQSVPNDDPVNALGLAMSFLMMEEDVPVTVTPFGVTSGFEIRPEFEDSYYNPQMVLFERVDDIEGYPVRVTFFYDRLPSDYASKLPDSLSYKASGDEDSSIYYVESNANIPIEEGDGFPDVTSDLPDLDEGSQTVSIDGELVLPPDSFALHAELDEWVNDLFFDCRQKLVDAGAIELPSESDPNEFFLFNSDDCELSFLDEESAEQLTADLSADLDNVIFFSGQDSWSVGRGVYLNARTDDELADYPAYYPDGYMINGSSSDSFPIPEDKTDQFANSLDDCHYVVAYMGLQSRVDEDFYDTPTADRVTVTTLVVVMDAQTREFVHIHTVGSDTPGMVTEDPTGSTMWDEARDYMVTLL